MLTRGPGEAVTKRAAVFKAQIPVSRLDEVRAGRYVGELAVGQRLVREAAAIIVGRRCEIALHLSLKDVAHVGSAEARGVVGSQQQALDRPIFQSGVVGRFTVAAVSERI